MSTIHVELPDESLASLRDLAAERGVPAEVLAREWIENALSAQSQIPPAGQPGDPAHEDDDQAFERDLDYVLEKNAELYRRLAR